MYLPPTYIEKGWVRKSTEDEYPTGGEPCQKREGLGMSTGIQPGRHEYQLSLLQWYTAKNGVLDLHPLGCSTCHEHQAPLGVLTHTCWGVTMHSKVFENSNKRCIIYTCMHRYIGMQYDTNLRL